MTIQKITYPVYRKYKNNKSFFKVISETEFEEIQLLGDKVSLHYFDAKILPDRNYIHDLTFNYENNWVLIEAIEYEKIKQSITYS